MSAPQSYDAGLWPMTTYVQPEPPPHHYSVFHRNPLVEPTRNHIDVNNQALRYLQPGSPDPHVQLVMAIFHRARDAAVNYCCNRISEPRLLHHVLELIYRPMTACFGLVHVSNGYAAVHVFFHRRGQEHDMNCWQSAVIDIVAESHRAQALVRLCETISRMPIGANDAASQAIRDFRIAEFDLGSLGFDFGDVPRDVQTALRERHIDLIRPAMEYAQRPRRQSPERTAFRSHGHIVASSQSGHQGSITPRPRSQQGPHGSNQGQSSSQYQHGHGGQR